MEKPIKFMELCEPRLVKHVRCIGMSKVLSDHVRIIFNRTEVKLEVVSLKEYESVGMVSKPLCSNLFNCNWAIEVSIETKYSSPPKCAMYNDINLYYLVL
jgi:ASC-1-like (ASCH) protein